MPSLLLTPEIDVDALPPPPSPLAEAIEILPGPIHSNECKVHSVQLSVFHVMSEDSASCGVVRATVNPKGKVVHVATAGAVYMMIHCWGRSRGQHNKAVMGPIHPWVQGVFHPLCKLWAACGSISIIAGYRVLGKLLHLTQVVEGLN